MKNWQDYQLILSMSRNGTMRGAASELNINHATVSRRLAQLNKEFDGMVFERTVNGYKATELGKVLVTAAQKIENIDVLTKRDQVISSSALSGKITLSIPPSIGLFLLMEPLRDFTRSYPKIELVIDHSFALVDLDKAEADVVIRGHNSPDEHLVGRRLCHYAVCLYGQKQYLQNTAKDDMRWIGKADSPTYPEWLQGSGYEDVPVGIRLDDVISRHHAAMQGLGLTRGACYMADPEPSLLRLAGAKPIAFQDLWVLTHPYLRHTPRIKLLMDFLTEQILRNQDLLEGRCPN